MQNIFGAIVFAVFAFAVAEDFFIYMSNPMRSITFTVVILLFLLIIATSYFDLGFIAGFVLTIFFIAIILQPYSVASCLNEFRERSIKAAIENPNRENWETFLNADNSLWDVEPSELKFCRKRSDLGSQIKPYLGFE